jgi:hypothetical protein
VWRFVFSFRNIFFSVVVMILQFPSSVLHIYSPEQLVLALDY